ncbi:unnamed protein product [Durusdinium trenchii]|uniref:Pentatricopeptide repeat-containing protein, chloroplastic n=2 Tax=Durusdinium trenchii TaxID=1381693 RepID=A0ABP0RAP4_9DINO
MPSRSQPPSVGTTWQTELWELRRQQSTCIPHCAAYSRTIAAFGKAGLWSRAQWLLDESLSRGSEADVVSYNSAILGYERAHLWCLALQQFSEITLARMAPATASFNSVMGACAWDSVSAPKVFQLLQELRDLQLRPTEITYTAAIKACEMCKDWLGALELLQKMRADQLKANCFVLTALMGVFKETRFWRDAVHTFAVLQSGQVPNVVSYNAVISACERSSSWSQALDCFFEFTQVSHLFANDVTFNALISSCEKGRQWQWALHMLLVMKESSVRLDVITYSAAISACEKALQWERALELLAEMRAERVPPNRITVNAAISAYGNGLQWPLALLLSETSAPNWCRRAALPDATTTSALITACGFGHEWELALAILSKPIPADTVAVNSCLSACARAQHWNEVLQLANDHMMALRLSPSVLTYNSLLDACVRSAEWAQGLEVLEGLGRWSLEADVGTESLAVARQLS